MPSLCLALVLLALGLCWPRSYLTCLASTWPRHSLPCLCLGLPSRGLACLPLIASLKSLGLGVDLTCVNLALLLAFIVHYGQWTWPRLPSRGIAHHCEHRLRHPRKLAWAWTWPCRACACLAVALSSLHVLGRGLAKPAGTRTLGQPCVRAHLALAMPSRAHAWPWPCHRARAWPLPCHRTRALGLGVRLRCAWLALPCGYMPWPRLALLALAVAPLKEVNCG